MPNNIRSKEPKSTSRLYFDKMLPTGISLTVELADGVGQATVQFCHPRPIVLPLNSLLRPKDDVI